MPILSTLLDPLSAIQHVLEMLRRAVPDDATRRLLARVGNRLIKMVTQLCQLNPTEKQAEIGRLCRVLDYAE